MNFCDDNEIEEPKYHLKKNNRETKMHLNIIFNRMERKTRS